MKKWTGFLAALFALTLTFSACGGSSGNHQSVSIDDSKPAQSESNVEDSSQEDTSEEASSPDSSSDNASDETSNDDVSSSEDDSSSSSSEDDGGEEEEPKEISDYVDFVVDVEGGRDIRVLQLTDVQTISEDQKRYETRAGSGKADIFNGYQKYIGQVIEGYNPDFIIMTGDNVYGEFDDSGEQFLGLISFMDSFEIPWAPVFGNHDNESNMGVDWQCDQLEASEYCLFKQRELTGNGNYTVGLTQDGELKRVFYMLDSNGCGNMSAASFANGHSKKTVGFGNDQIEWYCESMEEVTDAYPDVKLSMAFHIQIYAFERAMAQYGYKPATVRANPINLDGNPKAQEAGDFGYIGREAKGPWDSERIVWDSIQEYGVDSVFVGHEHCNSASIEYEGVRLTYGQKSSTYDRYNLLQADGSIKDSGATSAGTPIMGGTYFNLSKEDASIVDAGLYLYDHNLGYENPNPEANEKITIDNIPEGATVTEFDFNGTDFDATTKTAGIYGNAVQKVEDPSTVPEGFTGGVYSYTTDNFACTGIKFPQTVNANKLLAVFVKMYVTDYTVTSGKSPLLRIYNATDNAILIEKAYSTFGGETGKWVYADILELMQGATGIITEEGVLNPFTFLYRFYGASAGTVYFDSITMVSNGDPYTFDVAEGRPTAEAYGTTYSQYQLNEFTDATGRLQGGQTKFISLAENAFSLKFTMNAENFAGKLCVYGFTNEASPTTGVCVTISKTKISISNSSTTKTISLNKDYDVEIGFVSLYNGNTAYVFVKINGTTVAWELVDTYGKTAGNVAIHSDNASDSFTLS